MMYKKSKEISIEKINYKVFAKHIARVIMDLKSSDWFFIVQMAFGENTSWYEVEKICDKILKEK